MHICISMGYDVLLACGMGGMVEMRLVEIRWEEMAEMRLVEMAENEFLKYVMKVRDELPIWRVGGGTLDSILPFYIISNN